ncbi:MAG: Ig-like domain-containing protein [Roseobacter sp.]
MSLNVLDLLLPDQPFNSLTPQADGSYVVSESSDLFNGTFERAGQDLLITNDGSEALRISGYFLTDTPADIYDVNGAMLRGDIVARMAGPIAPGQYAQMGGSVGGSPIGQVEIVDGGASVQRVDGTVENLQVGMKIFQQDVLQTDDGGSLSVTFVDGTIFTLASASRMLIDELIYDPDATDNSGGFSLIQGSFVFIAGQVAKTGGMEVGTPSSTMGIRGTTVVVEIASEDGVVTSEVTLTQDPGGEVGVVELRDLEGNLIANITETETKWVVSALDGATREVLRDGQDQLEDSVLIAEAFAAFRAATSRVDAGDTFVTLSDPNTSPQNLDGANSDALDLDVDGNDEPEAIDPLDQLEEAPETDDLQPFDEGFNQLQEEIETAPILVVQGFEDATEDTAISGNATVQNLPQGVLFALGSAPVNGQATVQPDGSFAFVPNPNFNGTDSFTYTVTEDGTEIAEGTVVVEVLPVNDAPVADDATATVSEDGIVSGTVTASDVDGDTLTFSIDTAPASGEVLLLQNGGYTYTPTADFEGTDSFTVLATDPEGASSLATVTVTVEGVNDAPVAEDTTTSVSEDGSVTGTIIAEDVDGDVLTFTLATPAVSGAVALLAGGAYSYTPDADFEGTDSFAVLIEDGQGGSTTATVSVTVGGVNDAPVITTTVEDASGQVVENSSTNSVSGVLVSTDPDIGDQATWSGSAAGQYGAFTIAAGGAWTYTLDPALANELPEGATVDESFTATVRDAALASDQIDVIITVTGANDGPVFDAVASTDGGVVTEGTEENTATGQLFAFDPDQGDSVTWSGTSQAQYGDFVLGADGAWTYTLDNALADVLVEGQTVVETFEAFGADQLGSATTQTIEVTVTGTNDRPVVQSNTFFATVEGAPLAGVLTASDLDGPISDLTFSLADAPASGALVVVSEDGSFDYTPAAGFVGSDSFQYTVTDLNGGTSTATARVAVQTDPADAANQNVSVGISGEAVDGTAAGAIEIGVDTIDTTSVNLAIALDRSGSIGSAQWNELLDATKLALTNLAAQFEGSDTQVDVQVISYARFATTTAVLDLQDPNLLAEVDALANDYVGGITAWDRALQSAADFFFDPEQDQSEPNFLLFVSDGEPTTGAWRAPFGELTDPENGFDVTISAFGFGDQFDPAVGDADLLELNGGVIEPVFFQTPDQLVDAFATTPIFNPELISFEVTLSTETSDAVVIADETAEGLILEGTNFELPLASIENIASLLGESNQISITALFDLNNSPETEEIRVFTTDLIGKADTAQTLSGLDRADLMFGSDAADVISGAAGGDVILGYGGDDTLSGGTGADVILAGAGNDEIVVSTITVAGDSVDGGEGRDTLKIEALGEISSLIAAGAIDGIEVIDMENGVADTLSLNLGEIVDLSETSDTELEALLDTALQNARTITGDGTDTLLLDGEGQYTITQGDSTVFDASGTEFAIYTFSIGGGAALATLGVDADVDVSTNNAVA